MGDDTVPFFKRHSQLDDSLGDDAVGHDRFAGIVSVGCTVLEYASLVVLGCWE
jgi:hypothetical protein